MLWRARTGVKTTSDHISRPTGRLRLTRVTSSGSWSWGASVLPEWSRRSLGTLLLGFMKNKHLFESLFKFCLQIQSYLTKVGSLKEKKANTQMPKDQGLGRLSHVSILGALPSPFQHRQHGGDTLLLHWHRWDSVWLLTWTWQVVCTQKLILINAKPETGVKWVTWKYFLKAHFLKQGWPSSSPRLRLRQMRRGSLGRLRPPQLHTWTKSVACECAALWCGGGREAGCRWASSLATSPQKSVQVKVSIRRNSRN